MRLAIALFAVAAGSLISAAQPPASKAPATPPAPGGFDEHGFPLVPSDPAPKKDAKGKKPARETYGPQLDPLVKLLRSPRETDRVRGLNGMKALGEKAKPVARLLCDATLDTSESVSHAAMDALEVASPDLHNPVLMLSLDKDAANKTKAVEKLGSMGYNAKPALGLLLRRLQKIGTTRPMSTQVPDGFRDGKFLATTYESIRLIAPEDPEVLAFFAAWASGSAPDPTNITREDGLTYLVEYAGDDEKRRVAVAPYIIAGIEVPAVQGFCIKTAGEYGPVCRAALPALKRLKLSPDAATREAATAAYAAVIGQ